MGQLPAILKELKNPDSVLHIGGILSGDEPLCSKFSRYESDLVGWVSSRGWNPDEKFCEECAELYKQGEAYLIKSKRKLIK